MAKNRSASRPAAVRRFVSDYTQGFSGSELRRLFDRDASEAYRVLTRDRSGPEPEDEFERFFYRIGVLFVGISRHLTPGRRMLFLTAMVGMVLSFLDFDFQAAAADESWSVSIDFSFFWSLLAVGSLLLLLVLELVDRVRVRDELQVARLLQAELLPQGNPAARGYSFAHSYRTANEVGGDYYDFQPIGDGKLALVVGDASGHGMAAGLVMAIANATLRTALDLDPSCENVHALLNRAVCRTGDRRTFMSVFFAVLSLEDGRLKYVGAGHPYPLVCRADGSLEELGEGSLPLGLREELPAKCLETHLGVGDSLVMFSDGLPEAINENGQAFGFDGVAAAVKEGGLPEEIHDRVLSRFDRHVGEESLKDDLTLVVLRRDGSHSGPPPPPPPPPPTS